ncbi:MAG: tetratricopeptide repeat protein, partial [Thermoanaerobaculia bacterium]|nr:tetratricopeptide repeat protein [Thermoanaerobaculia bacterium]
EALQAEFNRREAEDKEVKALRNAVSAALGANDLASARAALGDLLVLAPNDADVLVQAAKVDLSLGGADRALEAARRALAAEPTHWEALYLQGLILTGQGRHAAARGALEESLRANPNFADTYAVLGTVLLSLRDAAGAVEAYRTAADLEPGEPGHYLNLASALARVGDAEGEAQAMATYRRLLREQSSSRS